MYAVDLPSFLVHPPALVQYYDPDYPHPAFIPYGRGSPMYRGDYYGTYSNPIPWFTAPAPRSGWYPYYPGPERQRQYPQYQQGARPFLPGRGYYGPRY